MAGPIGSVVDEPADPRVVATSARKRRSGAPRRVDLGDLPDDPDFVQLRQIVNDASRICGDVVAAIEQQGCTPEDLAAGRGRLRRAYDLLAAQSSSRVGSTASQLAEMIRAGASCTEAQRRWPEIVRLVSALAAEFAQPRIAELAVRSVPRDADIEISTVHGAGPARALRTDGSFVNVPRGRYKYVVRRGGMKPAVGVLDLIDDPRPQLSCILESDASRVDSSCRRGE